MKRSLTALALLALSTVASAQGNSGNPHVVSALREEGMACAYLVRDKLLTEVGDKSRFKHLSADINGTQRVVGGRTEMVLIVSTRYSVDGKKFRSECWARLGEVITARFELPGATYTWLGVWKQENK